MNDATGELPQHVTVEIMGLTPRLRDDLEISVQVYAGQTCYLIEDPISSRFSRIGLAEYTLISLLDGRTTIAEAIGQMAAIMGPEALLEQEAAALCKWLIDSQLAETEQSRGAGRLTESAARSFRRKTAARLNPIFQKVPLLNPDSLLRRVTIWLGWIFSMPAMLAWLAIVGSGAYCVVVHWDRFTSDSSVILDRNNWIWLLLTWLALKLVHETGHGSACRHFGGNVREAGVVFVAFAPLPYVDVTSSWRFDSKWNRIFTAGAGVYVELLLAAIMAIVWCTTDDPLLRQHARNVVVTATVVTAIFNLNPLMRFDGYYVLCDLLELPNLATHGRQLLSYYASRYVLGAPVERPHWPEGRTSVVALYAVAAFAWRVIVCVGLVIIAGALFWGAGIVLAATAVVLWVGVPTVRLIAKIAKPGGVDRRRVGIVATLAVASLVGVYFLPWYSRVTAPVIVDYETVCEVRSPVRGSVERVLVEEGDEVEAGQLLAVLKNRELELDAERLQIEIDQSALRARKFRQAHEIAAFQVETENRRALESRLSDLLARLAKLDVRAPIAGTVTRSDLNQLRGTFTKRGERILSIGAKGDKWLHVLVAQKDAGLLRSTQTQRGQVYVWGADRRWFTVRFERVHPRATTMLVHPALGSESGGPLPVRARLDNRSGADRWELIEPHILAEARCPGTEFASGQTGVVRIRYYRGGLGEVMFDRLLDWLRTRRELMVAHR